ncbi:MAG: immunoglobulin domain-containing protein [Holophagaceae bacterium]
MTFARRFHVAPALLLVMACGGGSDSTTQPPQAQAPTITTQPASQSVAVGQTVTFSVVASGTEPISYQWNWNGTPIVGATRPSFTPTSATIPADNGSIFTVDVTNAVGSMTSNGAILTTSPSPRAPQTGDLRFKDVGAVPFERQGIVGILLRVNMQASWQNTLGTPLGIGGNGPAVPDGNPINYAFSVIVYSLPTGMVSRDFACRGGLLPNLKTDLDALAAPNTVITSLDIASGQGAYGATWATTSQEGAYAGLRKTVQPSEIQAEATQAGAKGHVITAITYNSGQVYFVSYGWDKDPSTIYEAKVSTATASTISATAESLASEGYIITAAGGNNTDGFLLVGTRVQGDSMPRPIRVDNTAVLGRGYSPIVSVLDTTTGSDPAAWSRIWISEQ